MKKFKWLVHLQLEPLLGVILRLGTGVLRPKGLRAAGWPCWFLVFLNLHGNLGRRTAHRSVNREIFFFCREFTIPLPPMDHVEPFGDFIWAPRERALNCNFRWFKIWHLRAPHVGSYGKQNKTGFMVSAWRTTQSFSLKFPLKNRFAFKSMSMESCGYFWTVVSWAIWLFISGIFLAQMKCFSWSCYLEDSIN